MMPYSNRANPVVLRPGRARLSTNPPPTGSMTATNKIGTVRVASCYAATGPAPCARMTSGASATNHLSSNLRGIGSGPAGVDRHQLAGLAARYFLPAIYALREHAVAGGLISYGTDLIEAYHEVGAIVAPS